MRIAASFDPLRKLDNAFHAEERVSSKRVSHFKWRLLKFSEKVCESHSIERSATA